MQYLRFALAHASMAKRQTARVTGEHDVPFILINVFLDVEQKPSIYI